MRNIILLALVLSVLATLAYAAGTRDGTVAAACGTDSQKLEAAANSRHGISSTCQVVGTPQSH